jgi:hypothetical protein
MFPISKKPLLYPPLNSFPTRIQAPEMLSFPRGVDPSDGLSFFADFGNPDCLAGYESTFTDLTQNRIVGTSVGGYTFNNGTIKSLGLSGGQRFSIPISGFPYTSRVSVSCICSFRSGTAGTAFIYGGTSTGSAQGLGMSSGLVTYFGGGTNNVTSIPVELNKWYYLVGTVDGSFYRLYINGFLSNSIAASGGASPGAVILGNNLTLGSIFNGEIQEVRVYNRTLSDQEIFQLYYRKIPMLGQ